MVCRKVNQDRSDGPRGARERGVAVSKESVGKAFGALALLGLVTVAGMGLLAGCKSAPPLTADQAKVMIQARYDATPATGAHIVVNKMGMKIGITEGLWKLTKVYPNKFWADYTLTDEGKKAIVLANGGNVIEWRPNSMGDTTYMVTIQTVAANHLKALAVHDPESEELPGESAARSVLFNEVVDLTGVPEGLKEIAEDGMTPLSTNRRSDFVLQDGKWVLKSIV